MKNNCGQVISTKELLLRSHNGDKEAREQLILSNMGLVGSIVKRFEGRGYDREDLFQIGTIGLIKAVDKFDVSFDVMFSTYAVPMITGEIKRFLRDDGMIKVSRSLKELSARASAYKEQEEARLKKELSISEVASGLNVTPQELTMALEASLEPQSLQASLYSCEGGEVTLGERIADEGDELGRAVDRLAVEGMLGGLSGEERKLIYLRYYMDKTQSQTGKLLGISQVQVSRLENKILKKLRTEV